MNGTQPRLADVKCVPMRFQPGDRLLVHTRGLLDPAARKSLQRTVEKWAGDHVEVLIIDQTRVRIEYEAASKRLIQG